MRNAGWRKTEDRGQRTEVGGQRSEIRGRMTEDGSTAVDLATVTDRQDEHGQLFPLDLINEAVLPDAKSVKIGLAGEFKTAERVCVFLEAVDGGAQATVERGVG